MPPRRAAAVMVAVSDAVAARGEELAAFEHLPAAAVELRADGDVCLEMAAGDHDAAAVAHDGGSAGGAALGRWFFELLVGRAPLGRDDAFEPVLTDRLEPSLCALLARSLSDHTPQWPTVEEWRHHFVRLAGGLAPPEPPTRRRARRRRGAIVAVAAAALAVAVLAVLWAAPRWWDDAVPGAMVPGAATPWTAGPSPQRPSASS